jgi:two-component system phosphate regulon sensor histidine kinase PhoR
MARRRLLWRIYPSFLICILLCVLGVGASAAYLVRWLGYHQAQEELQGRAQLARQLLPPQPAGRMDELARRLAGLSGARVTLISQDGTVVGESELTSESMENHAWRPEVHQALDGRMGISSRYSSTLRTDVLYVALPWSDAPGGGVVRLSLPLDHVAQAMRSIYIGIGLSALGMAVLAGALAMLVSRRVTRLIEHMRQGAQRFAAGQLRHRLMAQDTDEFAGLAEALNSMAGQLQDKIAFLERYRTLQETVLSTMAEGVLALDLEERIISMNAAAARLLGADPQAAAGKRLQEFCRNPALQRLVRAVLQSRQTAEGEIVLRDAVGERCLQGRCSLLQPAGADCVGVLLVLADLTHLRQLENVRRDFVANVSHELKTPITSIKGFVETLREGAKDEPENARRFLEIVARQADRLDAIIEDLLSLSRLERAGDHEPVDRPPTPLRPVMEAAVADVQEKARRKNIQLALDCPPQVQGLINQRLLEQALVNLLDNAVKYSPDGGKVELSAGIEGARLILRVRDYGCGIEPQHLGRIFERFYRVDKARSREEGGTGLGLAIVKHIAQAHGGGVSVQSAPGAGSTFTITLPATT